jgi:hypothetical protein
LKLLERFSKKSQISNFMKIHVVGAELFHVGGRTEGQTDRETEGQTDNTKLIVAFHNFANTHKNGLLKLKKESYLTTSNQIHGN